MKPTDKIWFNGNFIAWDDARIHILSHVIHYGSSVFEGVRCYETAAGPAIFRLAEHTRRLVESAKIYRMALPFTAEEINQATLDLVRVNRLRSCYIRPVAIRGYGEIGVNPLKNPVDLYIACWEWGKYLGEEAINHGVDVCISSWTRPAPNTHPTLAKAGGNYLNSQLVKMEALTDGYAEGIVLDHNGVISEGSGENIFVIRDGRVFTTPLTSSILHGITRDSIMRIARDFGYEVVESSIPREFLYLADEIFFTGTAAEVTPVRSVDRIPVGSGDRGPITARIQKEFFDLVHGDKPDRYGWLSPVPVAASEPVAG
ncbi:MAG: branched-chain amino acid transaminase [Bryobacterales bacterium]|jgi:branched-chain amino acid aminotransferase|nr:branched-chain amino acid transaminase [Bryobacterales bacterium]